jgi:hypothetical protein
MSRELYKPAQSKVIVSASGMVGEWEHQRLDDAIDRLRARYGRSVVYFGTVQDHRDAAPMRISFMHIPELGLEGD